jgi:hypothetical protein
MFVMIYRRTIIIGRAIIGGLASIIYITRGMLRVIQLWELALNEINDTQG